MFDDVVPVACPTCGFFLAIAATLDLKPYVYCPACRTGMPLTNFITQWEETLARLKKQQDKAPNN